MSCAGCEGTGGGVAGFLYIEAHRSNVLGDKHLDLWLALKLNVLTQAWHLHSDCDDRTSVP